MSSSTKSRSRRTERRAGSPARKPAAAAAGVAERPTWPRQRLKVLWALNEAAARYWHEALLAAPDALDYLRGRGWDNPEELARRYGLGYASSSGAGFVRHVLRTGFPGTNGREDLERALLAVGLASRSMKTGRLRDLFVGRLMFPLATTGSIPFFSKPARIVAFGGRILPDEAERSAARGFEPPKFINTPETQLFQKRKVLYGGAWADRAIRAKRQAIVCEGQMDCLRIREAGFENVVACSGTALTADHVASIARFHANAGHEFEIILMTDADEAGQKAAAQGALVVAEAGHAARLARIPDGKDPDDFLRESGTVGESKGKFQSVLDSADWPLAATVGSPGDGPGTWNTSLKDLVVLFRRLGEVGRHGATDADLAATSQRLEQVGRLSIEPAHVADLIEPPERE